MLHRCINFSTTSRIIKEDEYLMHLREQPRQIPLDKPEYKFIPFLRNRAYEAFNAKQYAVAKLSFQKILEKCSKHYGPHYEWRNETLRMIVIATVRLREWDEAQVYMGHEFKGRDQTLDNLAMDCFLRGKREDTEKICLRIGLRTSKEMQRFGIRGSRDTSVLYYKSIDLLVRISERVGDTHQAE
jgi:hypothetical protein